MLQSGLRSFFLFVTVGILASASPVVPRAPTGDFGLYAYGDTVGGLSLYYGDGKALCGDPSKSNATEVSQIYFAEDSSTSAWTANPNATTSPNATWSNQMLFVPGPDSTDHQMGFTSNASSNELTTEFMTYGQFVFVKTDSGDLSSVFYVQGSSDSDQYSLLWNITDKEDDMEAVSLRIVRPSNSDD